MRAGPKPQPAAATLPPLKAKAPARRVLEFFETHLRHTAGAKAGQPLRPAPWQRQEIIEPLLEERFGFHELAAEDTLSPSTLPKYDSFTTYDFFIFRTVDVNLSAHASETFKIAAFLGRNFVFTVHRRPLIAADSI